MNSLFKIIQEIKRRMKATNATTKYLINQYSTKKRSLGLDFYTVIKTQSTDKESFVFSKILWLCAPGEILLQKVLKKEIELNVALDLIRKNSYRIHSSHFLDENFCQLIFDYIISTPNPHMTCSEFSLESKHLSFNQVMLRAFDKNHFFLPPERLVSPADKGLFGLFKVKDIEQEADEVLFPSNKSFSERMIVQDPLVAGEQQSNNKYEISLPQIKCFKVKNSTVYSKGQVFKNNQLLVYEPSADPLRRNFIAGLHQIIFGLPNAGKAYCTIPVTEEINLHKASLIHTRCPENYFHWTLEYLPKIKTLADMNLTSVPILSPSNIWPQQKEALEKLCFKYGIEIIYIEPNAKVNVDTLYIPSPVTFHPDDPAIPFWKGGALHKEYIHFLKEHLSPSNDESFLKSLPKRIYLHRSGTFRTILNTDELIEEAKKFNFHVIYPEQLSLKEQALLMDNADIVISPCGSALTNILFMKSGSKVVSLINGHAKHYSIYANLAQICDVQYIHIPGQIQKQQDPHTSELSKIHSSFSIEINLFRQTLTSLGLCYDPKFSQVQNSQIENKQDIYEKISVMSYLKSNAWVAGTTLTKALSQIFVLKLLTLKLGVEALGVYGQAASCVVAVNSLFSSGLLNFSISEFSLKIKTKSSFADLGQTISLWIALSQIVVLLSVIIFAGQLSETLFASPDYRFFFYALGMFSVLFSIHSIATGYLSSVNDVKRIFIAHTSALLLAATVIFIMTDYFPAQAAALSPLVVLALQGVALLIFTKEQVLKLLIKNRPSYNKVLFPRLINFSLVMVSTALLGMIYQIYMRSYLLNALDFGWTGVGEWQSILKISEICSSFLGLSILTTYYPALSKAENIDEAKLFVRKFFKKYSILVISLSAGLIISAPLVLRIVYDSSFTELSPLLRVQLFGDIFKFLAWAFTYFFLARMPLWIFLIFEVCATISLAGFSLLLIEHFQIHGLVYAHTINNILFLIISFLVFLVICRRDESA